MIGRGDIFWASLPDPIGSGPGLRRPVLVVQSDALNASGLATVVVVPLTSNMRWAAAPGNVTLAARQTGLPKDSVANATKIVSIDRTVLSEHVGHVSDANLRLVIQAIGAVLGRESD